MQMQTGPAAGQGMRSWLVWTGLSEWFNVALFGALLWYLSVRYAGLIGPSAVLGYLTLAIILIEGGGYWLVKRWRGDAPLPLGGLRALYGANFLLLLIFPITFLGAFVLGRTPTPGDAIFGVGLYLFGLGEFVHYFVWKINGRPSEWRRALRTGRPIPARFRREYERARRAAL